MNPIKKMKLELKAMAADIRENRLTTRSAQSQASLWYNAHADMKYDSPEWKQWRVLFSTADQYGLVRRAAEFRIKFVAYCLLRGRKYEEIESRVRPGNEIDMKRVEAVKQAVENEFEALRASQVQSVA